MTETSTSRRTLGAKEAVRSLSTVLDAAEQGEEFVITRNGRPIARISPFDNAHKATVAIAEIRKISRGLALGRLHPADLVAGKFA
jgi:prevent-host-death family protein